MAKPWERYQNQPTEQAEPVQASSGAKPWERFGGSGDAPVEPPQDPSFSDRLKSVLDTQVPYLGGDVRGYVKGGLNALPVAGGIGGALAGGGWLSIPAAGLGAGAGEALKNLGEQYILGENKTTKDIFTDPAKAIVEGASAEGTGKMVGSLTSAALESALGKKAVNMAGKGAAKVGEMFTGVPEKEIQTYAQNADKIKSMAKASDNSTAEAADIMRGEFGSQIQGKKAALNAQLDSALSKSDKVVDSAPFIQALENQKTKVNAKLNPEDIADIDDLIGKVKAVMTPDGKISVKEANDLKGYMQNAAAPSYGKQGQIFERGEQAQRGAKLTAAQIRKAVNAAEPDIASANNQLSNLHTIENRMNKNLIGVGKPEAALMSAGNGGNPRNAKDLMALGDFAGTDMLGDAEKLAAMRTFGSPKLMSVDSTGKAVGRMGLSAGLGWLAGGVPGAAAATALTSPMALRYGIDIGRGIVPVLQNSPTMQGYILNDILRKEQNGEK